MSKLNTETATCWHILTVTRGGTVSILKNLDAPTARAAYRKLKPDSHPARYLNRDKAKVMAWSDGWRSPNDGHIERVEILGPEGVDLDPWKGVEPYYYDMATNEGHGPHRMSPEEGRKLAAEEDARRRSV